MKQHGLELKEVTLLQSIGISFICILFTGLVFPVLMTKYIKHYAPGMGFIIGLRPYAFA